MLTSATEAVISFLPKSADHEKTGDYWEIPWECRRQPVGSCLHYIPGWIKKYYISFKDIRYILLGTPPINFWYHIQHNETETV